MPASILPYIYSNSAELNLLHLSMSKDQSDTQHIYISLFLQMIDWFVLEFYSRLCGSFHQKTNRTTQNHRCWSFLGSLLTVFVPDLIGSWIRKFLESWKTFGDFLNQNKRTGLYKCYSHQDSQWNSIFITNSDHCLAKLANLDLNRKAEEQASVSQHRQWSWNNIERCI